MLSSGLFQGIFAAPVSEVCTVLIIDSERAYISCIELDWRQYWFRAE